MQMSSSVEVSKKERSLENISSEAFFLSQIA